MHADIQRGEERQADGVQNLHENGVKVRRLPNLENGVRTARLE
jgi:hypothetical protein